LAQDQSPGGSTRRTALFGDTKYTPNLWSHLVRESLLFLGHDYQLFLGRGQIKSPDATVPIKPAAPVVAPSPGTPTHLIKKPIYKPVKPSPINKVLQSFAADGSFSQAVEAGVDATHIPEIFRSVEDVLRPVAAAPETTVAPKQAIGPIAHLKDRGKNIFGDLIAHYTPAWVLEGSGGWTSWWRRERVNKNVDACLPRREVDVLVVEGALSLLYPIYFG
jgi:nucleoporin NDC1